MSNYSSSTWHDTDFATRIPEASDRIANEERLVPFKAEDEQSFITFLTACGPGQVHSGASRLLSGTYEALSATNGKADLTSLLTSCPKIARELTTTNRAAADATMTVSILTRTTLKAMEDSKRMSVLRKRTPSGFQHLVSAGGSVHFR
ncbi:hypothetical protein IAU60_005308 [Kwoniella sp. DSM 27419]